MSGRPVAAARCGAGNSNLVPRQDAPLPWFPRKFMPVALFTLAQDQVAAAVRRSVAGSPTYPSVAYHGIIRHQPEPYVAIRGSGVGLPDVGLFAPSQNGGGFS